MKTPDRGQAGFSLVEMMVAVVITTIVAGAIYGLLADSQTGFRREPERTDRQQNIRAAMDAIMRDVANAASGMPALTQAFTPALDACSSCPGGGAPNGLNGQVTDELEIVTNDGARDNEVVCNDGATDNARSTQLTLNRQAMDLPPFPFTVGVTFADGTWTMRTATSLGTPAAYGTVCAGNHVVLNFDTTGDTSGMNKSDICSASANGFGNTTGAKCIATQISFAEVVRYRIRLVPEGSLNVPVLQRITSADGVAQVIARGIEDLQVKYVQAGTGAGFCTAAAPCDGAPLVGVQPIPVPGDTNPADTDPAYQAIVTQVIVTLSSRSLLPGRMQGEMSDAGLGAALRGSLTSSGSPRSALMAVAQQPTTGQPSWQ